MSRDGSGNYSLPSGNPVGTGTTISSTTHNTTMTDIASAITASIAKDGQTTPTANLPMGTYHHTGVSAGTARDQYAAVSQVQDGGAQYVGSVSGVDTITGSLTPAITAYVTGMCVWLPPAGSNTGAVTLALNGLAAKAVVTTTNEALGVAQLRANNPALLVYNGTSFVLVSSRDNAANKFVSDATLMTVLAGSSAGPEIRAKWNSGSSDRYLSIGSVDNLASYTERIKFDDNGWRFMPTTAPWSPAAGHVYYDTSTNKLRCYNGTTWNDLF